MTFDKFIIWLMAIGILVGAIDRLLKNKFGLGEKFEEGLNSMGPLALSMVGIVSLSPVISNILGPIIIPFYKFLGADPAMFASILANDMGGYQLALSLGENKEIALFSGLIVSSMLGCTIVFSIPVALGLIEEKDKEFFAKGLLIGLSTIPLGSIVGGVIMKINIKMLLINIIPIIFVSTVTIHSALYPFPVLTVIFAFPFDTPVTLAVYFPVFSTFAPSVNCPVSSPSSAS